MNNSITNNSILNAINYNKNIYKNNLKKTTSENNLQANFLKILLNKIDNKNITKNSFKNELGSNLNNFKNVKKIYDEEYDVQFSPIYQDSADYSSLVNRKVLIETSELFLTNPIIVGAKFPKDIQNVRIVISDDNRNIIFSKDLGPSPAGENVYNIDRNEIDSKYYNTDSRFPSVYNFAIVAKNQFEIVPATRLSCAVVKNVIQTRNNVLLDLGSLGCHPFTSVVKIL
ncbi:Basal-body rod modification protein FlgD [Buchnera aphidicola (Periphyllus testudinaceus)]|uniref:flagellar hook assembly protein FlgD n=1 Tax=Buchnera aphidicola TaxID=9 RepID=UPI0034639A68